MPDPESMQFNWAEARTVAGISLTVVIAALAIPYVRDWLASRSTHQVRTL